MAEAAMELEQPQAEQDFDLEARAGSCRPSGNPCVLLGRRCRPLPPPAAASNLAAAAAAPGHRLDSPPARAPTRERQGRPAAGGPRQHGLGRVCYGSSRCLHKVVIAPERRWMANEPAKRLQASWSPTARQLTVEATCGVQRLTLASRIDVPSTLHSVLEARVG